MTLVNIAYNIRQLVPPSERSMTDLTEDLTLNVVLARVFFGSVFDERVYLRD